MTRLVSKSRTPIRDYSGWLNFKGNDSAQQVVPTDKNAVNPTGDFTCGAWVVLRGKKIGDTLETDNHTILMANFNYGANTGYVFQISNNYQVKYGCMEVYYGQDSVTSSVPIPFDDRVHVAFRMVGTTLTGYINAQLVWTRTIVRRDDANATDGWFGSEGLGSDVAQRRIDGFATEFFATKKALTEEQLFEVMMGDFKSLGADSVAYKFAEGSGSSVEDASGNGNTGTIDGTPVWTTYPIARNSTITRNVTAPHTATKSLYFAGYNSNSEAIVPFTPDVTGFNINFWVYIPRKVYNGTYILGWNTTYDRNGFCIKVDQSAGTFVVVASNATASDAILITGILYDTWQMITLTYAVNSGKLYRNSASVGTDTSTQATVATGQQLTLGRISHGYTNWTYCKFYIHDLVMKNGTPWTQAEINGMYNDNTIPAGSTKWKLTDNYLDTNGGNELTPMSVDFVSSPGVGIRPLSN